MKMDHVKLTSEVLSVEEASSLATHPSCGAISLFLGTTRDTFSGRDVVRLEYEAYNEMAEKEMLKLCKEARGKWTLKHIVIHHRLGLVPVTETSVILAVSSEHRRESLDAVAFLIDSLKAKVPIWKKEVYNDGTGDWKKNKECVWVKEGADVNSNAPRDRADNRKTNQECLRVKEEADKDSNASNTTNNNKRPSAVGSESENELPVKKIKKEMDSSDEPCEEVSSDLQNKTEQVSRKRTIPIIPHKEKKPVDQKHVPNYLDPSYIQIVASKKELNRRIAAFQQRKREELDVLNVQEFCTMAGGGSSLNSCARTSAVVLRSKGSHGHLKLTRVVNEWGPQTVGLVSLPTNLTKIPVKPEVDSSSSNSGGSREGSVEERASGKESAAKLGVKDSDIPLQDKLPIGVSERLGNLERHLRLVGGSERSVPSDVYTRMKALEDRVLYLEGISPEYFTDKSIKSPTKLSHLKEVKAAEDDISVDDLDMKIYHLKMKLKQKQLKRLSDDRETVDY